MVRLFIYLLLICLLAACNLQQSTPSVINTPPTIQPTNQDTALCYFNAYGIGTPFDAYDSPSNDQTQTVSVGVVEYDVPYPVIAQNDLWYQITLSDGVAGWVHQGTGGISGDCANVPTTSTRSPAPDGLCTVYFDTVTADDQLYAEQLGDEIVAPMVAGVYLVVEARGQSGGWRVRLSDEHTGWLRTPDQLLNYNRALNGPCDVLPVEQSTIIGG
jgi:hypothetical protein